MTKVKFSMETGRTVKSTPLCTAQNAVIMGEDSYSYCPSKVRQPEDRSSGFLKRF